MLSQHLLFPDSHRQRRMRKKKIIIIIIIIIAIAIAIASVLRMLRAARVSNSLFVLSDSEWSRVGR